MPTRFVTLMNPRPRRRASRSSSGRFVRRSAVRRRRATSHANPSVRRIRRRRVARIHRNPPHSPAMRRKIGLAVKRANAARRSRPMSMVRRATSSFRRRASSRNSFSGGSLASSFKSAMSKPMLMKAGGAVTASIGTGYIMSRFGASLPGASNQYGRLLYVAGIPVVAAYLLRRKAPHFAEGLVIGGLVMTINSLMQSFKVGVPAAAPAALSRYAVAGELGPRMFSAYPQRMAQPGAALGGSNVAFPSSAW